MNRIISWAAFVHVPSTRTWAGELAITGVRRSVLSHNEFKS